MEGRTYRTSCHQTNPESFKRTGLVRYFRVLAKIPALALKADVLLKNVGENPE
jgi:hypothetical protein